MTNFELLSLAASVASIVVALLAIWLAMTSERRSQQNHHQTESALSEIEKRAAVTEQVVGDHFESLMTTVLDIVKTATTDKEVRTAEIQAKSQENAGKIQMKLMEDLSAVIQSGDAEKAEAFIKIFGAMTGGSLGQR